MRHGVIKETVNTLMLLSKFLISIFYLSNSSNLQIFQVLIYFKLFETKKIIKPMKPLNFVSIKYTLFMKLTHWLNNTDSS